MKTGWHRRPNEKRTTMCDWPRLPTADDAARASEFRATRRRRRRRRRQRASVRTPRRHHDPEHWPPADATNRLLPPAARAHKADAAAPRRPARPAHRSKAGPGPAATGSAHPPRAAPAGVRSIRHAASHRRATHDRARQSRSAHRGAVRWPAYPRARHRNVRGFATASAMQAWRSPGSRQKSAHIASPPRIKPTAMPSMAKTRALVSMTIGAKSAFSALSSITPSC